MLLEFKLVIASALAGQPNVIAVTFNSKEMLRV